MRTHPIIRIDTNVEFVEKGSIPDNGKVLMDKRQY